jgi:phenylacetate-CoA ligase
LKLIKIESIFNTLGYKIDDAYNDLINVRMLPEDEFIIWKEKKRWEIVKYHYKNNLFYKNKLGSSGINRHWNDLPIMEKKDFQVGLDNILSENFSKKDCYIASTSGSSGHPFYFAKDKYTHARVWAFWKIRYEELGLDFNSLEARFYGIPKESIGNFTERAKDYILNRKRFPIFDLSDEKMEGFITYFKNYSFDYIYGYTSAIVYFSRYLIKKGVLLTHICPSIKLVIATAEVCANEDRDIIERGIGVKIYSEYGTSEVGYLTKECKNSNWHILDNLVYIESTKKSELLVTDIFNKAQPFIRYKVGDLGTVIKNNCSCGNRGDIITNFAGRINDLIYLPSGKVAAGLSFYYISRSILESSNVLKEFIIRQTELDTFVFDIVVFDKLNDLQINTLKAKTELYLEKGLKIVINQVDKIDRIGSGKIQHFYSELEQNSK